MSQQRNVSFENQMILNRRTFPSKPEPNKKKLASWWWCEACHPSPPRWKWICRNPSASLPGPEIGGLIQRPAGGFLLGGFSGCMVGMSVSSLTEVFPEPRHQRPRYRCRCLYPCRSPRCPQLEATDAGVDGCFWDTHGVVLHFEPPPFTIRQSKTS